MFSSLRTRFGIPGVISVIALVFAMLGGAYAANSSSGGGKATASAKAKKGPRGPKGATGPVGPAGPAGPAGAKGDAGAAGANGSNGSPGSPGAAGKSVVATPFEGTNEPPGVNCEERDGVKFQVEGSAQVTYACNGADGEGGGGGLPETLPVGATEKGIYANTGPGASEYLVAPISYPIPLAAVPLTHYSTEPGFSSICTGSFANPTAPSGHLCVYGFNEVNAELEVIAPNQKFGTIVTFVVTGSGNVNGSWAVTG